MSTHVVIIGAYGSAGVAVATGLVEAEDIELTLIDDGEPGGGLCILNGCMPSKEVLSVAAHRYQARHDHRLTGELPRVDLTQTVATKNNHVETFAAHRRETVHELATKDSVEFIHGSARFIDDRVIAVEDRTLEADYVVIATGSRVNVPSLPGIDEVDYLTSADVLDGTSFGETGVVMGFGFVGLELVPYLTEAADMSLTIIEHDDRPLDQADPAFGDELLALYRREFDVEILTNTDERMVHETATGGIELTVEREIGLETIEADQLFLFTGRDPNIESLGLEQTAIDPTGEWVTDSMQAREDERVFVVGDANDKTPILHVAKEEGFTAAENILAHREQVPVSDYEGLRHEVVFSGLGIYPYARVGHTAESAAAAGYETVVVTRAASQDGVFTTKDVPYGLASLVVDEETGTVLGYQGLHFHADVMAKTLQVIIMADRDVRTLPDRSYHPTTPEILDGLFREASDALR